jgi:hypothetical protein
VPHVPRSRRAPAAGLGALALTVFASAGIMTTAPSPRATPTVHASDNVAQTAARTAAATPMPTPAPSPPPTAVPAPASAAALPPRSRPRTAAHPAPPAPITVNNTLIDGWGLVEEGWPQSGAGLAGVESKVGRSPNFVEDYVHWGGGWGAYTQAAPFIQASISAGATPVLTWMSDDPTTSDQSAYDLSRIAAGDLDAYVRSWADGLRGVGHQILLRLDPEMNGNWESYAPGRDGQTAADYVNAWRHIHAVFATEGATNVRWVWSPNVEYTGSAPLRPLYPGDADVDWLALDGYNWGTTYGHAWQSFSQVFDPSLASVEAISSRPVMLAEVGSTEVGGNKAAWISDMFSQLSHRTDVRAFIWFDLNKETDWRIASSAASSAAFAAGLATVPSR